MHWSAIEFTVEWIARIILFGVIGVLAGEATENNLTWLGIVIGCVILYIVAGF